MLKRSKLLAPHLDVGIERPRLLALMTGRHSIRLLAAPAGFGKSTLAAEWLSHCGEGRCWLSLDAADKVGPLLWINLIECLRQLRPGFGGVAQSLLQQSPLALEGVVESLARDLAQWRVDAPNAGPNWVIDDIHLLQDGPNLPALLSLLSTLTGWGRVLITSRFMSVLAGQTALPAASIDLIDQHQLAFDTDEVQALAQAWALPLPPQLCLTLHQRTEGWVTPIQMILRQMRNDGEVGRWNDAWLDGQMFTLAPLIQAHQAGQSPSTTTLLTLLALAPRFDRSLITSLAALVEGAGKGLDAISADTFVIRLQQAGWWKIHDLYRVHLLEGFGSLPQALRCQAVDRMAEWLCEHGAHAQALALQAEHAAPAAVQGYALRHYRHWLRLGLYDLLEQAATLLDDTAVNDDPRLCLLYLWARGDRLELAECRQRLQRALAQATGQADEADITSELYSLLSYCEQVKGDPAAALQYARQALEWSERASRPLRSRPLLTIALLTYMQGHMGEASEALARTLVCAQEERHYFNVIVTLGYWIEALYLSGQFDEALAIWQRAREWLQNLPDTDPADQWLDVPVFDILIARGEQEVVHRRLQPLLRFADHAGASLRTALIYFCAARVHYFQGDMHSSLEYLSRVEAAQARLNMSWNWGWASVDAWRRRIAIRQNRRQELQQWFTRHPVDLAADIPFVAVEERLLDAGVLAQLGHYHEAETLAAGIAHRAAQQAREFHRLQALIVLGNINWLRDSQSPNPAAAEADTLATSMGAQCILRSEALWLHVNKNTVEETQTPPVSPGHVQISKRERAVLALLAQGKSNSDIAIALHISTHTAKTHMKNILRKLDAKNRTEALVSAKAKGML